MVVVIKLRHRAAALYLLQTGSKYIDERQVFRLLVIGDLDDLEDVK
jgi:hypothetical protein